MFAHRNPGEVKDRISQDLSQFTDQATGEGKEEARKSNGFNNAFIDGNSIVTILS